MDMVPNNQSRLSSPWIMLGRIHSFVALLSLAVPWVSNESTIPFSKRLHRGGLFSLLALLLASPTLAEDLTVKDLGAQDSKGMSLSIGHSTTKVRLAESSWRIRHSTNSVGKFVLIRNDSSFDISVAYDNNAPTSIGPSATTISACGSDAPKRTLFVWTASGDSIHRVGVDCGDSLQISMSQEPTEAPSGTSEEQASFTVTENDERWRVSHTRNANGRVVLIRNFGGPVSLVRDGAPPTLLAPGITTTWSCSGANTRILAKTESDYVLYNDYLECGDGLTVTKAGN